MTLVSLNIKGYENAEFELFTEFKNFKDFKYPYSAFHPICLWIYAFFKEV